MSITKRIEMSVIDCIKYCFSYTNDWDDKITFISLFTCVPQHRLTRVSFDDRESKEKRINYIVRRLKS